MSLADEIGNRGSKLCMQICVNNVTDEIHSKTKKIVWKSRKHLLDEKIGLGSIIWLSPLENKHFKEYQLNQIAKKYPKETNLGNFDWSWWPSTRQPQWDAIGVAPDGTLVIVEAKAHTSEMESDGTKAKPESKKIIKELIESVMGTDSVWMKTYYQTANRYLFLDKLLKANKKVHLVFLNFLNDVTLIPEDQSKWDSYLDNMHKEHPLPKQLEKNTSYVFMDIWKDNGLNG